MTIKKQSRLFLLITLSIPFVIVLVTLISLRVLADRSTPETDWGQYSDAAVTEHYDFTDFTRLQFRGHWRITVEQGSDFQIAVTGPEYLLKNLAIERSGRRLSLYDPRFRGDGGALEARINIPALDEFTCTGDARIRLAGFSGSDLSLRCAGNGKVTAENNRLENLDLDCTGHFEADFSASQVTNAEVNLTGASRAELQMAGGQLTGSATGACRVIYYGPVNAQHIRTLGGSAVYRQ